MKSILFKLFFIRWDPSVRYCYDVPNFPWIQSAFPFVQSLITAALEKKYSYRNIFFQYGKFGFLYGKSKFAMITKCISVRRSLRAPFEKKEFPVYHTAVMFQMCPDYKVHSRSCSLSLHSQQCTMLLWCSKICHNYEVHFRSLRLSLPRPLKKVGGTRIN